MQLLIALLLSHKNKVIIIIIKPHIVFYDIIKSYKTLGRFKWDQNKIKAQKTKQNRKKKNKTQTNKRKKTFYKSSAS